MIARDQTTTVYDVIVGRGRARAARRRLPSRSIGGLSVAQLDRYAFPRMKPCGGGITIKSSNALRFDPWPMVRGEARAVEFNVWQKRQNRFSRSVERPLRMVVRPEFDNWLVAENRKRSGFQFFDAERVLEIGHEASLFPVRTARRTFRARQLVGADGAYSVVNKLFRVTEPKGMAVAVEVALRRDETTLAEATPPCFDFGAIGQGYGWVFPKDDHWNVGLYTLDKHRDLRAALLRYVEQKGFRFAVIRWRDLRRTWSRMAAIV